jgi:hypothetical protein
MRENSKRSGIAILITLTIVSAIIWTINRENPIFVFGGSAVLYLLWLMVKGLFSPRFRPFTDDGRPADSPRSQT